jgi:hypothetical protein
MRMFVTVVTVAHSLDNHLYEYVLFFFSFIADKIFYSFFRIITL